MTAPPIHGAFPAAKPREWVRPDWRPPHRREARPDAPDPATGRVQLGVTPGARTKRIPMLDH